MYHTVTSTLLIVLQVWLTFTTLSNAYAMDLARVGAFNGADFVNSGVVTDGPDSAAVPLKQAATDTHATPCHQQQAEKKKYDCKLTHCNGSCCLVFFGITCTSLSLQFAIAEKLLVRHSPGFSLHTFFRIYRPPKL